MTAAQKRNLPSAESPKAAQQARMATAADTGGTQAAAQGNSPFGMKPQTPLGPTAETPTARQESLSAQGLGWVSLGPPPSRPAVGASRDDLETYFQKLAVWVQCMLAEAMKTKAPGLRSAAFSQKAPYQFQPLPIQQQVGHEQSSSYKAPWSKSAARVAMTTAGRYEAGGNAMWLSVLPQDAKQRILAGTAASVEEIDELEAQFFAVTLRSGLPEGDVRTWERLIFPDVLAVGVRDKATVYESEHWQMSLPLVSGHCYVQAWYSAMSKALAAWGDRAFSEAVVEAGTDPQPQRGDIAAVSGNPLACVACLLECALTVTIHARECPTDKELGIFSNEVSEKNKASEKLQSDTFPAFAAKALLIIESSLEQAQAGSAGKATTPVRLSVLQKTGVRYNGTLVNRTMFSAIQLFDTKFNAASLALLTQIERRAGKDCLTKHYAKLMRLGQICSKEAEKSDSATVQDLVQYTLEALENNLRLVKVFDVTQDWLEKHVPVILGRREVAISVGDMVADFERTKLGEALVKQELQSVVDAFQSYPRFEREFALSQGDSDPVEDFKRRYKCEGKVAQLMTDLLYDVMAGVYDGHIADARAAAQGKSASGAVRFEILKAKGFESYRELYRQVTLAQSSVDLSCGDEVPQTASRQLRRYKSDPTEDLDGGVHDKDRQEAFASIQKQRAKYVEILAPNDRVMTEANYQQLYEKSKVYQFSGSAGESHRLFVFSAELHSEGPETPWATPVVWEKSMDTILSWLSSQNAPCDTTMAFDGRSRSCRKAIELVMEKRRHFCELWVVYAPTRRMGRKVFFASDNKETCGVSLPLPRTQLAVKSRDGFNRVGEESTHDSTYTGVTPLAWGAVQKFHAEPKKAILGFDAPIPNNKLYDCTMGMPLFWQERKNTKFWAQLLHDLNIRAVFDATAGTGQLARACLQQGILYTGVAKNQTHAQMLNKILDRHAVSLVGQTGAACHDADLAALAKEHFSDLTEILDQQDLVGDTEPKDEDADE